MHARIRKISLRPFLTTAAVLMMVTAAGACDQPMEPETELADQVFQTAGISILNAVDCSDSALPGPKVIDLRIKLSTGAAAAGAVVSVINPVHGVLCAGAAAADGSIRFEGLKHGAAVVLSVRDEVNQNVLGLEIVPPNPVAAPLLADGPSYADNRQHPALFAGAACKEQHDLTWAGYLDARSAPCVLSSNVSATLKLKGDAPTISTRVLDASNAPLQGVIVAALSPANTESADLENACAVLPWIDQTECTTNSNGPALLQALGLTDDDGRIELGVNFGSNPAGPEPVVIETIALHDGQTLFGTLVQSAGGEQTLLTAPGMCTVETVPDYTQPSGRSELDIRYSAHSVGLTTILADGNGAPLAAPALVPVNGTLVVKLSIHASTKGGKGKFTIAYRLTSGPLPITNASFVIGSGHPDSCTVDANIVKTKEMVPPVLVGHCAPATSDPADLESGRRAYTLFFVLSGVDAARLVEAGYIIRTDRDHLDPSRSHPAYDKGGVRFTGLNATSCPVRLNNDGRWLTV